MKVSFIQNGRLGNHLFQYLICKVIEHKFGHTYSSYITSNNTPEWYRVTDATIDELLDNPPDNIKDINIVCDGYFQKAKYYIQCNRFALNINSMDIVSGKLSIKDILYSSHKYNLHKNDIVIHLRLDDFIQMPCATSDIIPPQYYLDILESLTFNFNKLYIVCDKLKYSWEYEYIKFFKKWNPTIVQQDLLHDCALLLDAPTLIHSNSSLCWILSYFSKTKLKRYIPQTNFYKAQELGKIDDTDILYNVLPLEHKQVFDLDFTKYLTTSIFPLSYCIPDEIVVSTVPNKTSVVADIVPGNANNYKFIHGQEEQYYAVYRDAMFGITMKKGGWDCLRHYEIMANGCFPMFIDLENCPDKTLTTIPKQLIINCNKELLPWKEDTTKYNEYSKVLLEHVRNNCTTSACAKYILSKLQINPKKILLLTCDSGINYTRELTWIGIKRYLESVGGEGVEYPPINYLYESYQNKDLYGNGFTYSGRLKNQNTMKEDDIISSIQNKYWDLIIYGKIGVDEDFYGTIPRVPFWDNVMTNYSKNKIIFLYGGDICQNLSTKNKHSDHLLKHSQYGQCFVRELAM